MKKLRQAISVLTLLISGAFSAALFAAMRSQDGEYLMIGFPLFLVASSIHLLVSKRWKGYLLIFAAAAAFGHLFHLAFY